VSRQVAVIGAGPSGLATVKELLEEGHEPTCFEQAEGLSGVFRFDERRGVVWETCRLTSSGLLTAFSDFPVSPDRAGHMAVGEYVDYLARYCQAFGVGRHLRFGAMVDSVTRGPSGDWTVRATDARGTREERFDAVAVCSGLHQHPHWPRFPGQESFTGTEMHGAEYRRASQVAGRKVLIVGAGESGADLAAEVSEHAAEALLSLRRGVAVLPRRMFGMPKDYETSRILNSAAHWVFQTRQPGR
jgi:dimethylaniline monooxygenase (N-oxide forming)